MTRIIMILLLTFLTLIAGCVEAPSQPEDVGDSVEARGDAIGTTAAQDEASASETKEDPFGDRFPNVLAVKMTPAGNERVRFDVTLSSAYDSPDRYADAWRVLDKHENQLGIRILGHDHASEQPFTRSQTVAIPSDASHVFVEGRDQLNGWSGQRYKVLLP